MGNQKERPRASFNCSLLLLLLLLVFYLMLANLQNHIALNIQKQANKSQLLTTSKNIITSTIGKENGI